MSHAHAPSDLYLVGWGHTRFGRHESTLEELIAEASTEALTGSGIEPTDIDAVFLGHFNSGLEPLAFPSSLPFLALPEACGVPATRVENACASGSAALHQGLLAILAGAADKVLVVGAEKMTHAGPDAVGAALLGASYDYAGKSSTTGFAGLFAAVATAYNDRYGDCSQTLAHIAAKNHRNGLHNPYAQLRKELDFDFCNTVSDRNPLVAAPLRRTDCSPVSDGAAAIVLSRHPVAGARTAPVKVLGFGQGSDQLPDGRRDPLAFPAVTRSWNRALDMAGVLIEDLSLIELHDCFTIAELNLYEAIGLTGRGDGRRAVLDGLVEPVGRTPVNVSGGLKAKGHPVGATGVSQHVMVARQLTGTAGDAQLPSASVGAVQNMGGLAVSSYATVLSAV
ncbi:thiolase domain-containing protein [Streptomyces sp. Li-HN-5-11]|uniref:thiolase domain-containing protein n=1 Tax=Streptomyces sp. Li-HN-5-11 TaxID=3075432 RepID=UPI0028AE6645|nr:thiolase domain-containing protein [Streptomyces sp. Li-HN-5-11]WNM31711.1 thiolase domain-containing protein [Streptomyces sp. Li-HN-5-11]